MSRWPLRDVTRQKVADRSLGDKVHRATLRTVEKRAHLVAEIPEWEALRVKARELRLEALDRREKLLDRFTRRLTERGATVTVVRTAEEAAALVTKLAVQAGGAAIKSKSMATEEIGLNGALERAGVTVTETDLGEWIVQQAGQAPSHLTAPAIHLSVEDVARIFHERAGVPLADWVAKGETRDQPAREALARELSLTARRILREKFLGARVGITGANLLVAESGTIVLLENEGNIRLTTCLPRRHIVVAGIEKLIAHDEDLAVLLRLLPVSATAQRQSCYVSLFADKHPDLHVVLLDRGRTELAKDEEQRDLLTCLRCGACMNVCPVYRCVGGHAYGGAYGGPIGALLLPHFCGLEEFQELPFASSLCGACADACPVGIPLPERLLQLRARLVERGISRELGWTLRRATSAMRDGKRMERAVSLYRLGRPFLGLLPVARRWSKERELPRAAAETFRAWWEKRRKKGSSSLVLGASSVPTEEPNRGLQPAAAQPAAAQPTPPSPDGRGATQPAPEAAASAPASDGRCLAPLRTPPTLNPVTLFSARFAELGPCGETEFRHLATAAEARAFVRTLVGETKRSDVIVEGEEPERKEYAFGITGAAALIADTGGVALDLRRRDLAIPSLLVDTHVVVAHPSRLVPDLPAFFRLRAEKRMRGDWYDLQVLATGPSRTADIEKTLVIPAHGPRRMVVVLCDEPIEPSAVVGGTGA